jgi:hypothetical protein
VQYVKKFISDAFKISLITIFLFITIDILIGDRVLSSIRGSEPFRIQHSIYHHTLKPNFDGVGRWGDWSYRLCTNSHGFKDRCDKKSGPDKAFDLAFIGDSFTEGIGLPFEDTFVGMIADKNPQLRIANLGVVSYSPAIHLAKLKNLYSNGYSFKHVIVFIDIGDVYDEANAYDLHNEAFVVDKGEPYPLTGLRYFRRLAARYLPLTGEAWVQLRQLATRHTTHTLQSATAPATPPRSNSTAVDSAPSMSVAQPNAEQSISTPSAPNVQDDAPFTRNIYEGIYLKNYPKSEWTYNTQSPHYGNKGVMGTLGQMKQEMAALHALVSTHGGTLSVGVYPWPGQILYDEVESLQVSTWREFCATRCLHFYNTFPSFFKLAEATNKDAVVQQYYFAGDAHFNTAGNKVIADTILAQGIQ